MDAAADDDDDWSLKATSTQPRFPPLAQPSALTSSGLSNTKSPLSDSLEDRVGLGSNKKVDSPRPSTPSQKASPKPQTPRKTVTKANAQAQNVKFWLTYRDILDDRWVAAFE